MAHSLSAKKRVRQNEVQRMRNRARRSTLKSSVKGCVEAISGGSAEQSQKAFLEACEALDREANRGLIHKNAAARSKSRLARRLNTAKQKPSS